MTVSVCIIAFNHQQFISEAIEGALSQVTNFDFELVIGEDCSHDRTREIVKSYAQKFPAKIRLLLNDTNLGMMPNFIATLNACRGEFIALCEGDDYWTDPHKLQRQYDFMKANNNYALCAHLVTTKFEETCTFNEFPVLDIYRHHNYSITPEILIKHWGLNTCSFFFKNEFTLPNWFVNVKAGDFALALILGCKGQIFLMDQRMAVYRRHKNGVTGQASHKVGMCQNVIQLLTSFDEFSLFKYTKSISEQILFLQYSIRIFEAKRHTEALYYAFKCILANKGGSIQLLRRLYGQVKSRNEG